MWASLFESRCADALCPLRHAAGWDDILVVRLLVIVCDTMACSMTQRHGGASAIWSAVMSTLVRVISDVDRQSGRYIAKATVWCESCHSKNNLPPCHIHQHPPHHIKPNNQIMHSEDMPRRDRERKLSRGPNPKPKPVRTCKEHGKTALKAVTPLMLMATTTSNSAPSGKEQRHSARSLATIHKTVPHGIEMHT
jgi:hypothetical protein